MPRPKAARLRQMRLILPCFIAMILVFLVLPHYSVAEYSMLKHTTSHLGAQDSPNAWVMNTVFILLGASCILESWFHLKQHWAQKILLTLFGFGLVLVAFFRHAPIVAGVPYSPLEDAMHSLFAGVVGFSFTVFAFSAALLENTIRRRGLALLVGLMAVGFSILIFTMADLAGLWQRIMFVVSFTWLVLFFEGIRVKTADGPGATHG